MNATQHSITYNGHTLHFVCEEIPKQYYNNAWRWAPAKLQKDDDIVYLGLSISEPSSSTVKEIILYHTGFDNKATITVFGGGSGPSVYLAYVNKKAPGVGDTVIYGFGDTGFGDYGTAVSGTGSGNTYCLNDIIDDGWTFTIDPRIIMNFRDLSNHVVASLTNHVLTVYGGADIDPHTDPYYHDDYIEQKLLTVENMKQALIDYDTNLMGVIDNKIDAALGAILNASY